MRVPWIEAALAHRRLPVVLALLSALLLLPAVWAGFQLDDHFQRFRLLGLGEPSIQLFYFFDGDPERNRMLMDLGVLPWWTAETFRHAALRYLSVVTMQLDYLLWPEQPALMHVHSLAWLALMVWAAALLYREISGMAWAAGLAALLYAVDEAHAAPAVYLANRNALVATAFGVLCLLCFARWRSRGWRPGAVLGPLFLALGLAAGEIALATAAYLGSYALLLDRGLLWARLKSLLPHGVVLVAWACVYKLGGFGAKSSGFYVDPLRDPASFALDFAERAPILLLGQWTPVPAELALATPPVEGLYALALVAVAALALLFAPVLRRDRVAGFWCLGALLSVVPIAATGPQNRLLFMVGLGSMGLLAQGVHALASGVPASRWARAPAWAGFAVLGIFHLLLAPPLGLAVLDFQAATAARMDRAIASVPHDAAIAEQDLVLVNPPEHLYLVSAIWQTRQTAGLTVPRRLRALSAGSSPMTVTRLDENTLALELRDGLFPDSFTRYVRSRDHGFSESELFAIAGLSIEVQTLNAQGDPERIAYRFDVPLEDPSLRWLRWNDGVYEPWSPPGIGKSVELPSSRGIFAP